VNVVAGKLNQKNPPRPIDRIHRAYRGWVVEFSESFGCEVDWLAHWFEQFTFMRIVEQKMPKNLAAFMAKQDCLGFFSKVGSEPS
jgi:hypothetical protein